MHLMLEPDLRPLPETIDYTDRILLIGSCFTEHMSDRLQQSKFKVLANPNGILFNPLSVSASLDSYIAGRVYEGFDLFYLNELWNSWDHHTRFSNVDQQAALASMNSLQATAGDFISSANWIIITLGSGFQYYLKESGRPVANNHRAPAQWFDKRLLPIEVITASLSATIAKIREKNAHARILFTISPVRHIRDGVVDNNRSKARLLESVHTLCERLERVYYYPAYELVIDILRDYRYYDIDFVHPNYLATSYVWEHFLKTCISAAAIPVIQQVQDIVTARSHRPRFTETDAHRQFMERYAEKAAELMIRYPYLDLNEEVKYFSGG